jgi:predicted GNAT superfamily acetyltransferase
MKSIYDRKGLQTDESQKFAIEIEKAIQPVLKRYLEKGFSIRDLSHEAQAVVRDCELDHMIVIHVENAKRAKVNLERKKLYSEVAKKHGLTKTDWDYGEYEMPGGC